MRFTRSLAIVWFLGFVACGPKLVGDARAPTRPSADLAGPASSVNSNLPAIDVDLVVNVPKKAYGVELTLLGIAQLPNGEELRAIVRLGDGNTSEELLLTSSTKSVAWHGRTLTFVDGSSAGITVRVSPTGLPTAAIDLVILDKETKSAHGLDITLVEIVEKREMDGGGLMQVGVKLRAAGVTEDATLYSRPATTEWRGYTLTYLGGWRSELRVRVSKP